MYFEEQATCEGTREDSLSRLALACREIGATCEGTEQEGRFMLPGGGEGIYRLARLADSNAIRIYLVIQSDEERAQSLLQELVQYLQSGELDASEPKDFRRKVLLGMTATVAIAAIGGGLAASILAWNRRSKALAAVGASCLFAGGVLFGGLVYRARRPPLERTMSTKRLEGFDEEIDG